MSAKAVRRVSAGILLVAMALAWWGLARPSSLGGPLTFITVTGVSMEPGLETGDLALVYAQDEYAIGDVVAFRSGTVEDPGGHVIHRIKAGNASDGFVMQGDNNDWEDPWQPTAAQIDGTMVLSVPEAGLAFNWIRQPLHFGALMAAMAIALIVAGEPARTRKPAGEHTSSHTDGVAAEDVEAENARVAERIPPQRSGSRTPV